MSESAGTARAASPFRYQLVGVAFATLGVALFAVRPILIKLAYAYAVDPVTLLALRMVFAAPFFIGIAVWAARRSHLAPVGRRDWLAIALLGFLGYYLASFLDFLGLQYVSAGLGRLILFLYPTMVVMLSWAFFRQPAGPRELLALAITYAGLATVLGGEGGAQRSTMLLGAGLCLGSAMSYSVYLAVGAQVVRRVGSLRFTAYATIVASVLCILQFFALRPLRALDLPAPVYAYSVAMSLGSTVIPILLTGEALKRIGANRVAIMGAIGPVMTIVLGYFGLDERLTGVQVLGSLLVLAGVVSVMLDRRSAR